MTFAPGAHLPWRAVPGSAFNREECKEREGFLEDEKPLRSSLRHGSGQELEADSVSMGIVLGWQPARGNERKVLLYKS